METGRALLLRSGKQHIFYSAKLMENHIHDLGRPFIVCREYTCLGHEASRHEESEEILWRKRVLNFSKNMKLR